jgi:hypothetical protein
MFKRLIRRITLWKVKHRHYKGKYEEANEYWDDIPQP